MSTTTAPVVGPRNIRPLAPVVPVLAPAAPIGTHGGYGVDDGATVRHDGTAVTMEAGTFALPSETLARVLADQTAPVVADLKRRNRAACPPPLTDATRGADRGGYPAAPNVVTGARDDTTDAAWIMLAHHVTGPRAEGMTRAVLVKITGENGGTAPDGRLFASGQDRDDILSRATLAAHATLTTVLARTDRLPVPVTGTMGGWLIPRGRACLACPECTTRVRTVVRQEIAVKIIGRPAEMSRWILSGCAAPEMTTDFVTPGRIFARALMGAARDAMRRAGGRRSAGISTDAVTVVESAPIDASGTLMDGAKMPARTRAAIVTVAAQCEAEGVPLVAANGHVSARVAAMFALILGTDQSPSGVDRTMARIRKSVDMGTGGRA